MKRALVWLISGACLQARADLSTLFLTWSGDPLTTMDVQWLEEGHRAEPVTGSLVQAPDRQQYEIGYVEGALPGDGTLHWSKGVFPIHLGRDAEMVAVDPEDSGGSVRLAWSALGLHGLIEADDDQWVPVRPGEDPWAADGVELFIRTAEENGIQISVAVREDGSAAKRIDDRRSRKTHPDPARPLISVRHEGRTLSVEWLLLWSDLKLIPEAGETTLRFQAYINDIDPGEGSKRKLLLYPKDGSHSDLSAYADLILAGNPVEPEPFSVGFAETDEGLVMDLRGPKSNWAGEWLDVLSGSHDLGRILLEERGNQVTGRLSLPAGPGGGVWQAVALSYKGEIIQVAHPDSWMAHTPPPASRIEVSPDGMDWISVPTNTVRFGPSKWFVHRAAIRGLQPGSEYALRHDGIGLGSFVTAPARLSAPLVFVEGGDIGVEPVVVDLHRQAALRNPLFAFVGGDLAYADGTHAARWIHYLRDWSGHMRTEENRLIPMLAAIGNHEVRGGYGRDRLSAPYFYTLFGDKYRDVMYGAYDFGDYLSLISLDSGHTAPVSGEQTEWLKTALQERAAVGHLFVAYHVPAFPSHRPFDGSLSHEIRTHWVPVFDEEGVDLVFEHHDHTYKRTVPLRSGKPHPDGIVYVGDGNWGRGIRPVNDADYLHQATATFNVLEVTVYPTGRRDVKVFDESGRSIDHFQRDPIQTETE